MPSHDSRPKPILQTVQVDGPPSPSPASHATDGIRPISQHRYSLLHPHRSIERSPFRPTLSIFVSGPLSGFPFPCQPILCSTPIDSLRNILLQSPLYTPEQRQTYKTHKRHRF